MKKQKNKAWRLYLAILISGFVVWALLGCGGGFKGDSEGAKDLGGAIFGPDSLK